MNITQFRQSVREGMGQSMVRGLSSLSLSLSISLSQRGYSQEQSPCFAASWELPLPHPPLSVFFF
ncbi:hypothetical protein FACS189487_09630 [Campylobacterota bacterium]|nr:hypothetical protein FACS189487_09630 [Campylobacterota bacterium]